MAPTSSLEWRDPVRRDYADIWTAEAAAAYTAELTALDDEMAAGGNGRARAAGSPFSSPTLSSRGARSGCRTPATAASSGR